MAVNRNTNDIDLIPELYHRKLRTLVDDNHGVFKYGISDNPLSYYEDPTFLGFTIELDEESPLFTDAKKYIENNLAYPDIRNRQELYESFITNLRMVFNSQETESGNVSNYVKQHYINSISGLHNLTKRLVSYKEDKLTFELYEDISLFSSYLTNAYNNLRYSYEYGRVLIPENLLHFNMYLKISEIRNLTSIRQMISNNTDDVKIANALKLNTTSMIYKLTDCLFNMYEGVPFEDQLSQSGIDANRPPESTVTFDMYYKRVNLYMNTPLIPNSIIFDNSDSGLRISKSDTDITKLPKSMELTNDDLDKNNVDKERSLKTIYNEDNVIAFKNIKNKGASGTSTVDKEFVTSNLDGYDESMKILNEYNNTDTKNEDILKNEKNITNIDDVFNGEDAKRNSETDNKNNRKTNIEQFEEKWNDIRTANNAITSFYSSKKTGLNNTINDKIGGGLGNTLNKGVDLISNELLNTLQKYENILLNKKNEILNKFVYEIKKQTNILIDYNVYTDDIDPMLKPMDDFVNNVGNNLIDDLLNDLKSGTDTGFFGGGSGGLGI